MATVAEKWVKVLDDVGVRYVFGIPSGPWVEYMEALRNSNVQFVLVSNETSGAFMLMFADDLREYPVPATEHSGPGRSTWLQAWEGLYSIALPYWPSLTRCLRRCSAVRLRWGLIIRQSIAP